MDEWHKNSNDKFWDEVHLYENTIKKRDNGLYKELLFIDGVLWP